MGIFHRRDSPQARRIVWGAPQGSASKIGPTAATSAAAPLPEPGGPTEKVQRRSNGVCLVLAGLPLNCLVAFCSSSWFKPLLHSNLAAHFPSSFPVVSFFSLCVLTACSQSHRCCLPFFLCKCEMFTLSGGQTRVNGVSSCLHTGRGRGS